MYLEGKERDYFVPYAILLFSIFLKCKLMLIFTKFNLLFKSVDAS